MGFYRHNLQPRLRLLRNVFTRRFVYTDVVAMTREYGVAYDDVPGTLGPIDLTRRLIDSAIPPPPDFSNLVADIDRFTIGTAPDTFNSEPSVGRFLGQLAHYRRAETIIELGCFVGWATAHLAQGMPVTGRIFAVDYMQQYLDAMLANLRRHNLDGRITAIRGMSLDAEVLRQLPAQADIIFLDTSHLYPDTRDEILAYAPRLTARGCLVLHDTTSAPGVRQSIVELRSKFDVHLFGTERSNGISVLFPK